MSFASSRRYSLELWESGRERWPCGAVCARAGGPESRGWVIRGGLLRRLKFNCRLSQCVQTDPRGDGGGEWWGDGEKRSAGALKKGRRTSRGRAVSTLPREKGRSFAWSSDFDRETCEEPSDPSECTLRPLRMGERWSS